VQQRAHHAQVAAEDDELGVREALLEPDRVAPAGRLALGREQRLVPAVRRDVRAHARVGFLGFAHRAGR
jgi:hypothetical protein